MFKDKLKDPTNKYIPKVNIRTSNKKKPWFTNALKNLENKRNVFVEQLQLTRTHTDGEFTTKLKTNIWLRFAVQSVSFYATKLPNLLRTNQRQFW